MAYDSLPVPAMSVETERSFSGTSTYMDVLPAQQAPSTYSPAQNWGLPGPTPTTPDPGCSLIKLRVPGFCRCLCHTAPSSSPGCRVVLPPSHAGNETNRIVSVGSTRTTDSRTGRKRAAEPKTVHLGERAQWRIYRERYATPRSGRRSCLAQPWSGSRDCR